MSFGKVLLVCGLIMAVCGLLLILGSKVPWLGKLPGDIRIERNHFSFYFPITTCLLASLLISLLLWLWRK